MDEFIKAILAIVSALIGGAVAVYTVAACGAVVLTAAGSAAAALVGVAPAAVCITGAAFVASKCGF